MNGMIDFYLQTCLGQSYFDGQLFVDAHMESLRRRKKKQKKNHFRLPPDIGKTPDSPSLCTASNKQIESSIQPPRCWTIGRIVPGASTGQWEHPLAYGMAQQVKVYRRSRATHPGLTDPSK